MDLRLLTLMTLLACGHDEASMLAEAGVSSEPSHPTPEAGDGAREAAPMRPTVLGALSDADVERAVLGVRSALEACAATGRLSRPGLAGEVLVKLVVGAEGRVSRTEVRSATLAHPPTEACVSNELAKAVFPRLTEGGSAVVSYPVVFERAR